MTDLPTRIENARPEDVRGLLVEAFDQINAVVPFHWGGAKFFQFLDASAYVDAALLLVPEGWEWTVENGGHVEMLANRLRGPFIEGNAATPALAIAAAAVRAKEPTT